MRGGPWCTLSVFSRYQRNPRLTKETIEYDVFDCCYLFPCHLFSVPSIFRVIYFPSIFHVIYFLCNLFPVSSIFPIYLLSIFIIYTFSVSFFTHTVRFSILGFCMTDETYKPCSFSNLVFSLTSNLSFIPGKT